MTYKTKENIVLSEQASACNNLKRELEKLMRNLQDGIMPEENEISALKKSFQQYQEETRKIRAEKARLEQDAEEYCRLLDEKQKIVVFNDILPAESDDPFDVKYFETIANVRLVKTLVLQKLVPEIDGDEYGQFTGYLMKKGYITKVAVITMGENIEYHMLTTKGCQMVNQENNLAAAKATDPSFLVPKKLLCEPAKWSTETFQQAAILRKYYESLGVPEFAVFTDGSDDQVLFGCEIRDSYSVCYSFVACFVPKKEKSEAAILYEIARSDKIDDLTIVLTSAEEEKRLKLQHGLDTRTLKKLRYYILSKEGENEDKK